MVKGEGSKNDPYQISNKSELLGLGLLDIKVSGQTYCRIVNDIDFEGESFTNDGLSTLYSIPPAMILDGNGHTIKNLEIKQDDKVGCFENSGVLKNLNFRDVTLIGHSGGVICYRNIGSIINCSVENCDVRKIDSGVGYLGGASGENSGVMRGVNCEETSIRGETAEVGGLVGSNWFNSKIETCRTDVNIKGGKIVGGLVGSNSGPIIKSSANGKIIGSKYVGGLAGVNNDSIENSDATVEIGGDNSDSINFPYKGGLVGKNNGLLKHSYFNGDLIISIIPHSGSVIGINYEKVLNCYSINSETHTIGTSESGEERLIDNVKDIDEAKEKIVIGKI